MKDNDIIIRAISSLENGQYDYETADALREVLSNHTSLQEKVRKYEEFLHAINAAVVACNHKQMQRLVDNAFGWSYAHRSGNGEPDEDEQQEMIYRALQNLTNTGD